MKLTFKSILLLISFLALFSVKGETASIVQSGGGSTVDGLEDIETATDDAVPVGNGSTFDSKVLPDSDGATQKLQYDTTTNAFSAGTDDDIPESGDFGNATDLDADGSVSADSVALTTDTTGNYVASATASQGLTLTGTEGGSLGIQDCAANEIMKRNAGDTAWECASDATGGTPSFDAITTGTNTTATMTVGTGSSITFSGSGTITATEVTCTGCVADAELATDFISETELDTFAELDSQIADKTLVNTADGAVWLGVHDFGGATSLETVNGTGPTVDAAGELAVDTTNDQLIYFGTAARVLDYRKQIDFTLESPADADNFLIWKPQYAVTVTDIECIVDPADSAESVVITMEERDSNGDTPAGLDGATTITCANTTTSDDGALSNGAVDADDYVSVDIGTVTGTVTQLSVRLKYTVDAT